MRVPWMQRAKGNIISILVGNKSLITDTSEVF